MIRGFGLSCTIGRALPVVAVMLSSGCYRYAAINQPTVTPGAHVRLALADSSPPSLRSVLGEGTIAVEGQVVATTDTAYAMSVAATLKRGLMGGVPTRIVWAGESVLIPRASISGAEVRSLDRGRTTRAVALVTVAALVSVKLIVSGIGGTNYGGDGGPIVTPP